MAALCKTRDRVPVAAVPRLLKMLLPLYRVLDHLSSKSAIEPNPNSLPETPPILPPGGRFRGEIGFSAGFAHRVSRSFALTSGVSYGGGDNVAVKAGVAGEF